MEAAGGVQEHQVVAVLFGVLDARLGDVHGVNLPHLKHGDVELCAHGLQLLDSGGAVHVAGHEKRTLALLAHIAGQLCAVGGLARALQAHQHHHTGALGGDVQLLVLPSHEGAELLVDDLDDHLRGVQGLQHVGAHGPVGDLLGEVLDHLIADVGLQQRHTHLAHGLLHVAGGQPSLAAQAFERGGQFIG